MEWIDIEIAEENGPIGSNIDIWTVEESIGLVMGPMPGRIVYSSQEITH